MTDESVQLPVIADEGGQATRITLDDEFEFHTWLESFFVRDGKAHFLYLAQTQPSRQHYVRYDLVAGRRELDVHPEFRGRTLALQSLDGFFATRSRETDTTVFVVSRDAKQNRLACLASDDNGATWRDHAVSPPVTNPYSIGGCRELTQDGWITGSFTSQIGATHQSQDRSKVYFFRIRAE